MALSPNTRSRVALELSSGARARAPKPRPSIYVRPEPWTAQYYKGDVNFMDQLLLGIKDEVDVTVLDLSLGNPRPVAGILAILVAVRTRSVLAAIVSGMGALWLLQWAIG